MDKKYTFEEFEKIIAALRAENGCPWDREQTHESLRPCMMEEAAELVASIRIFRKTGNFENMREELGDVLLQVVMHSRIAQEEGLFTMEDVITEVSEKMIRRHPHVFGSGAADTSDKVLETWEEIKKEEKKGKKWIVSELQEIPRELPALTRAVKVRKKADKIYESLPKAIEAAENLTAGAEKLTCLVQKETPDITELEEVIGSLLINLCDVSRQYKLSPEQILTDETESMIERFEKRPVRAQEPINP